MAPSRCPVTEAHMQGHGGKTELSQRRKGKAVCSELTTAGESAAVTWVLVVTQRSAEGWESLLMGNGKDPGRLCLVAGGLGKKIKAAI